MSGLIDSRRPDRVPGAFLAVRGRSGQYGDTDTESRVPRGRDDAGGRLRRPGGGAGQGRER